MPSASEGRDRQLPSPTFAGEQVRVWNDPRRRRGTHLTVDVGQRAVHVARGDYHDRAQLLVHCADYRIGLVGLRGGRKASSPHSFDACGTILVMPLNDDQDDDFPDYRDCRSTVVDAIRYVTSGQSLEEAADEALHRLRDLGVPIPEWVPRLPEDQS